MTARILIVDDIETSAAHLTLKMQSEYFDVVSTHDGFNALRLAVEWHPDLILLDVMMPGMDGFETCRRLKADQRTLHIPVIMITALDGSAERLRGFECGADDFLSKPVDHDTLLARLKGLVRLKRLLDEWRARSHTTRALGLATDAGAERSVAGTSALIIDDWDSGSDRVRDALDLEGIIARRARDEAEALELCAHGAFDLLVLSLAIRVKDPLRLASRLRAADAARHVPMLLIAEPDQCADIARKFDLGANEWLVRPVDRHELRLRARNQIRRKLYQDMLRADLDRALELALTDPLTGLYNRRYLLRHLENLLAGHQNDIAVMMIDLDDFKQVNDRYGHAAGDRALTLVSGVLKHEMRVIDLVARFGGEEFAVVMPATGAEDALSAGERLRRTIEQLSFEPTSGVRHTLTASIGIAVAPGGDLTGEALVKRADDALYAAKQTGRNRVRVTGAPT